MYYAHNWKETNDLFLYPAFLMEIFHRFNMFRSRYSAALKAKYYTYNARYRILGLIRLDTVHWVTSISLGYSGYPSQETQDYLEYLLPTNVAYRFYQGWIHTENVTPKMNLDLNTNCLSRVSIYLLRTGIMYLMINSPYIELFYRNEQKFQLVSICDI